MIDSLRAKDCYLRKATQTDCDLLYEWVNDKQVRQSAFNSNTISYEEHVAWFNRMMNDENQIQLILMDGESTIGQIRLTFDGENAEVDYSISNTERGFGYGKVIIRLAIEHIKREYPSIKMLVGKVKPSNNASYQCFLQNGFEEEYRQMEYKVEKKT